MEHLVATTFTEEQVREQVKAQTAALQEQARSLQNENVELEGRSATLVRGKAVCVVLLVMVPVSRSGIELSDCIFLLAQSVSVRSSSLIKGSICPGNATAPVAGVA
jgi:uracil phosphoribosyltransferase